MLNQNCQGLDPFVTPLINRVNKSEKIGACRRPLKIHSMNSKNGKLFDCIDLEVPYADQTLKWTIFFDSECPELGPDFVFNDENFLADPDIETLMRCVPSLANWNYLDSNSLLTVLKELLAHYKDYQIDLLKSHASEKLRFEYESLIKNENVCADDVEVILLNPGTKTAEAKFFIRLEMDFSKLPQRMKYSANDAAMLMISFSGRDWYNVVPQLFLTKSVEEIFGSQEHLQIPPFPPSDGLLIDYVPRIVQFLEEKMENILLCFTKKKDFISSLLVLLRGCVMEYDAAEFNRATVLVEKKDFHFFIHFRVPAGFPRERPEVVLQSAYHMDQTGHLITHNVNKFLFNIQMEPLQMIQAIMSHIEENEVDCFQSYCTRKNRF
ncbi:BRISC and BRCA1-A complex member 2-like [Belonocnema kinseyi]|uniref:BRISC and BRCA1-A complex member 2-like n=1 Tax=Belonocnema kinseyi TaxID=2817044 RepID=UPI00143CD2B0|nr:BRISC and BRCA1-A complex member 2-like [Belonocnema kinseyi]